MARRRKHNPFDLHPTRHAHLTFKHGAFYYMHKDDRGWERLGTDLREAKALTEHYNDVDSQYGLMSYWLDEFLASCKKRVGLSKIKRGISKRTYEDYQRDVVPLKLFFGGMLPSQVEPHHIGEYLDLGVEQDRPVRANREKSCLSAAFTWMIRQADSGVKVNPCFGVKRNPETKRDRYVEDWEFNAVYAVAARSVRALMDLIYRTLQRPEDIIEWTPRNIRHKSENNTTKRVIRTRQGKTGADLDIEVTPEIDAILDVLWGPKGAINLDAPLIRSRNGTGYTYSGLCANLQRNRKTAKLAESFGFYDLKGKGATDMWLAGVPLEKIQVLCGHDSVTTTEIYVKCRWRGTVTPNQVQMTSI